MKRIACLFLCLAVPAWTWAEPRQADVLVYGATPAGITAALAAASGGHSVLLVEPTARIGGLVTHGLSHTDFRTFEGLSGAYLTFTDRVQAHYRDEYGPDSPQAKGTFRGTHAEPKVNLAVFERMLEEFPKITVLRSAPLSEVAGGDDRITGVTLTHAGETVRAKADVYIDGSYEGDLMAAAGVEYRVGREGRDEFGEALAPAAGDDQLQGYNFRFVMTRERDNQAEVHAPPGYDRELFAGLVPLLESGKLVGAFGKLGQQAVFKDQDPPLPNGKYDINDVSRGLVRLSLPGDNREWPDGDADTRRRIFDEHLLWNAGLLYFLQNDPAVPKKYQDDARRWGWCKDEFTETGHVPPQLYVREARRMVGRYMFSQRDTAYAEGDARAVLRTDAVAVGDYGHNCHGTEHEGPRFGGRHTGEFYSSVPPYQIPYGVLVPETVTNLLVPGAMGSTHVGFCALRYEPIWMNLGQAAGHAARLALERELAVQEVPVDELQKRLWADRSATVYVSDVKPDDPEFAAVMWWGTAGGLHGIEPAPATPGQRGKNITGQYFEAYPGHEAKLDRPLTAEQAGRWRDLAKKLGLDPASLPEADGTLTRGGWIRSAHRAKSE